MLDVYYTIDTEFWADREKATPKDYEDHFVRDILGTTARGNFGLAFQLERFAELGLKASCFIETTHTHAFGIEPLQRMVDIVKQTGHDIQLHCHTEWLANPKPLNDQSGQHMHHFSESDQAAVIADGIAALQRCGVSQVCAFRAGNYGADSATLRILAANGILFDTSYNFCYLDSACQIAAPTPMLSPQHIDGVWEIPISYFDTFRGPRHVQVSAASNAEMEAALMHAYQSQWKTFVIVSHSFELVHREHNVAKYNGIQTRRFERFCRFLKKHSDKFRTRTFSELAQENTLSETVSHYKPLKMSPLLTLDRLAEHAWQRYGW